MYWVEGKRGEEETRNQMQAGKRERGGGTEKHSSIRIGTPFASVGLKSAVKMDGWTDGLGSRVGLG